MTQGAAQGAGKTGAQQPAMSAHSPEERLSAFRGLCDCVIARVHPSVCRYGFVLVWDRRIPAAAGRDRVTGMNAD